MLLLEPQLSAVGQVLEGTAATVGEVLAWCGDGVGVFNKCAQLPPSRKLGPQAGDLELQGLPRQCAVAEDDKTFGRPADALSRHQLAVRHAGRELVSPQLETCCTLSKPCTLPHLAGWESHTLTGQLQDIANTHSPVSGRSRAAHLHRCFPSSDQTCRLQASLLVHRG